MIKKSEHTNIEDNSRVNESYDVKISRGDPDFQNVAYLEFL